eukprot:1144380-Pelagomonas_calceolata.AAC.1
MARLPVGLCFWLSRAGSGSASWRAAPCFLALHELLPLAMEHTGRVAAVSAVFVGMGIMSANLLLLGQWMGDTHVH